MAEGGHQQVRKPFGNQRSTTQRVEKKKKGNLNFAPMRKNEAGDNAIVSHAAQNLAVRPMVTWLVGDVGAGSG
jgi:hypothetical protein